jgi:hypothetical protein
MELRIERVCDQRPAGSHLIGAEILTGMGSVMVQAKKIRAGTYLFRNTPGPDDAIIII